MGRQDIRWKQRFAHFSKALVQLRKFIDKGNLNELEEQGLIKSFEYTYELAWNTLKDFFEFQGETEIRGSRDAFRLAFRRALIVDGETWMNMIESRTLTTHTYDEDVAREIAARIVDYYYPEFEKLHYTLAALTEESPQCPGSV